MALIVWVVSIDQCLPVRSQECANLCCRRFESLPRGRQPKAGTTTSSSRSSWRSCSTRANTVRPYLDLIGRGGQVAFTFIIFSQFMCRRMHQWCDQNIYTLVPTTSKRNGLLIGHSWQLHVGADHFTGGPHMQRQSTT